MSKKIDVNLNSFISGEPTIEEIKAMVDSKLSAGNKGKWSADIVRDVYGKVKAVNVNLPDSVTENEKANAVSAINANSGVASSITYPHTYIDEDMESLAIGTIFLPGFNGLQILEGTSPEGITEDEAKSGTKSYGLSCGVTAGKANAGYLVQSYVFDFLPNDVQIEYWVKCTENSSTSFGQLHTYITGIKALCFLGKDILAQSYKFVIVRWESDIIIRHELIVPDLTKWYKVVIKTIGETNIRIEVQDELGNVIMSDEGLADKFATPPSFQMTTRQLSGLSVNTAFTAYVDDLKIIKLDR